MQLIEAMFWIALAGAAQLSAPQPVNLDKWFSFEDVPTYLVEKDSGVWLVGIRVDVAPDGSIQRCEAEKSSRIPELDKLTCSIVLLRGRFLPARSTSGSPATGVYRDSVSWSVGAGTAEAPYASNPDVDVYVQSLPRGIKSPTFVRVMFAVDQAGNKSSCVAEPGPSMQKINNDPVLVPIACEQVMSTYRATPAKDGLGNPVPSIQDALVRFSVKQ
jgi:hypothetical protein